jgi:hypothetical protein
MTFTQWLRKAVVPRVQASRASRRGKCGQPPRRWHAPRLEWLEDRLAPATLMVTNTDDSGAGSLRDAILANVLHESDGLGQTGTGNDVIQFDPSIDGKAINLTTPVNDLSAGSKMAGPSAFFISNNDTLVIDGQAGLTKGITINGPGSGGPAFFRLFDVDVGSTLTLQSLTLSGGVAQGFSAGNAHSGGAGGGSAGLGGAIFSQGTLMIQSCTLTGNTAQGGGGGSLQNGVTGYGGSGGAGLGAGSAGNTGGGNNGTDGGGPNQGAGGVFSSTSGKGGNFGGGGGGGYGNSSGTHGAGGAGGFGAGGGGPGSGGGASAGKGGFGGGAGGNSIGGAVGDYSSSVYGGGGGGFPNGGGGAGMGGAVFNYAGTVTITNSTFTGNTASGGGGGGAFGSTPGQAGHGLGGGIFNLNGTVTLNNDTIDANTATTDGGAVFNLALTANGITGSDATLNLFNTILANSMTATSDLAQSGTSATINATTSLIQTGFAVISSTHNINNITGQSPNLAALASNGGPTQTMALQTGSPAIDKGTTAGAPPTDQRGVLRDVAVDIGAYEVRFAFNMIVNTAAEEATDEANGDNFLTLREAIELADGALLLKSLSGAEQGKVTPVAGNVNTITFDGSKVGSTPLTLSTVGDTRVGPSAFLVDSAIVINGGSNTITLSAAGTTMRLFDVTSIGSLTLENLTLKGGAAQGLAGGNTTFGGAGGGSAGLGGAICNQGTLTILDSTLTGNAALGGAGGSYKKNTYTYFGGAGGAGLDAVGGAESSTSNNGSAGGGPNGPGYGVGGTSGSKSGTPGGFGGGGGGGYGNTNNYGQGSAGPGGFGGGGGGGGFYLGAGGLGGFGGGGGGGSGSGPKLGGHAGGGGYGGGFGQRGGHGDGGAGGGGAGMGGAIFNGGGNVTITNSTITGNTASGGAGGTGHTYGNAGQGAGLGGGLFNLNGTVTLYDDTIDANTATTDGGAVFNLGASPANGIPPANATGATVTLFNTILANSVTATSDLAQQTSVGSPPTTSINATNSLIQTGFAAINGTNTTNITGQSPNLATLAPNGGPTKTMALLPGSPAIDHGSNGAIPAGVTTDQRGNGHPRIVNGKVDIGAFESKINPVIVLSPTTASVYGQVVTFTATVSAPAPGGLTPTGSVTFKHDGNSFANQPVTVDSNGKATFSTPVLSAGMHTITAVYSGDANFSSATAPSVTQSVTMNNAVVNIFPSSTLVNKATNEYQAPYSTNVTFTVVVAGKAPGTIHPPAGDAITLTDTVGTTTTTIASGMLDAIGHFSFSVRNFAVGTTHVIKASFTGDNNFKSGASVAVGENTIKAPVTNTVASASTAKVGTTLTITASLADAISGATAAGFIPTGVVFFRDTFNGHTTTIGSASGIALDGSGQAFVNFSPTPMQVGTHSVVAIYTGSSSYAGNTSAPVTISVTATQAASLRSAEVVPTQTIGIANSSASPATQPASAQALDKPGPLTASSSATRVDAYFASLPGNGRPVGMLQVAHKLLVRKDDSLTGVW